MENINLIQTNLNENLPELTLSPKVIWRAVSKELKASDIMLIFYDDNTFVLDGCYFMDTNESIDIDGKQHFSTEIFTLVKCSGTYLLKEGSQIEITGNAKINQKIYRKDNSSENDLSGYGVLQEDSEIKVNVDGKFEVLSENNVIKLILKDNNDIIGINEFIKIADI